MKSVFGELGLWRIPTVYIIVSIVVGIVFPRIEAYYLPRLENDVSVGSGLAFFGAVGSGMMALTGIVFAVAFVVVQFSAAAYSPRLTLLLVADPRLFHTLGIFMSTFIYSLIALLWTDRGANGKVPEISAIIVMLLVAVSMLAFTRSIQLVNELEIHYVLKNIGRKGREALARLHAPLGHEKGELAGAPSNLSELLVGDAHEVRYSGESCVFAAMEREALVDLARRTDSVFVLERGIGDGVMPDELVARVYGSSAAVVESRMAKMIRLAPMRAMEGDPKYAIRLLVDIAIRALSPAINDPTTAVESLDEIEGLIRRIGQLDLSIGHSRDETGKIRLIFPSPTWDDYLELAFSEIREYGDSSLQVMRRLRAAFIGIADSLADEERRDAVLQQLKHLDAVVADSQFDAEDRRLARDLDRQGIGLTRTVQRSS